MIIFVSYAKQKEYDWENTPPPLYSPATIPPSVRRPARQGLPADPSYSSRRPAFSVNKKVLGKADRKAEDLSGLDGSHRTKVEEYGQEEEDEYYDDFEVVEKGKRRSDGYGDEGLSPMQFLLLFLSFLRLW